MIFNQIIGMLLPGFLGLKVYDNIDGEEKSILKRIERYFLLVLFTNLITFSFMVFVRNVKGFEFTNQFTIKYILLSLVIAFILPIVNKFWQDKFKVNVVVKKNEKNTK